jgi:hypothetical protein
VSNDNIAQPARELLNPHNEHATQQYRVAVVQVVRSSVVEVKVRFMQYQDGQQQNERF